MVSHWIQLMQLHNTPSPGNLPQLAPFLAPQPFSSALISCELAANSA